MSWSKSHKNAVCDLDFSCVLLDTMGRCIEIVDFNDPISNDGAITSGGDTVSADDNAEDSAFASQEAAPREGHFRPDCCHRAPAWCSSVRPDCASRTDL